MHFGRDTVVCRHQARLTEVGKNVVEGGESLPEEIAAQRIFGAQAGVYASSQVHVRDASLDVIQRLASRSSPGDFRWAVDLGTGAGFTAFAMAVYSHRVVATDPIEPMLQQARRIGNQRGLDNVGLCQNTAEALPFADDSVDLVTCRVAAHHFRDFERALDEIHRVLRVEGVLLMADSIAPEDDSVAEWMNDIELRRDFSHVKNRRASEIEATLDVRRMNIVEREHPRIQLRFNAWVARSATPAPQVESLRRDFLNAPAAVREAFQIQPADGDIRFSWPCLVFQAVKSPRKGSLDFYTAQTSLL